jgi:LacI family transcriptional regulator
MSRNPNQRDIAKAADVCVATVSLAMRNHPSISDATRKRIRKIAEELGYRPNPRVSELMGQIRRNRSVDTLKERVALFWADMDAASVEALFYLREFESGARGLLEQNGIGLEVIYRDPEVSSNRVGQILHTRGIRGLILAPLMQQPRMELNWNWINLSVVIAGSAEWQPDFNRVRFNHFAELGILVQRITECGCQRMGLVIDASLEQRSLHAIDGGFWAAVPDAVRKSDSLFKIEDQGREAFYDWVASFKPDSLIIGSPGVLRWIEAMDAPPPVFMRSLERPAEEEPFSGIRQDYAGLGEAAAEQLLAQFQINRTGVPQVPLQTLITGKWEPREASA